MRICVISYHSCPFSRVGQNGDGGMSVYLRELCSALVRIPGVRVDIFVRRHRSDIAGVRRISPGLRVVHLPAGPEASLDRKGLIGALPEFCRQLENFIRREGPSQYRLLYSHYWLSGMVGERIRSGLGVPMIHTFHTLGFLKRRVLDEREPPVRLRAEARLADRADAIVASSRAEKSSLTGRYDIAGDKIHIISPGVNPELFSLRASPAREGGPRRLRLLYVGRIEPVKGLMILVRSLGVLRSTEPGLFERLELEIVGGGWKPADFDQNPEIGRVKQALAELGLNGKVAFSGSLSQEKLAHRYAAADALVVPSLYESFGLVVLEALACGKPVLVSGVGRMRDLIREEATGMAFRPDYPGALADCLRRFDRLRGRFWEPSRIRGSVVPLYSWDKAAAAAHRIFSDLIEESGPVTTRPARDESLPPA